MPALPGTRDIVPSRTADGGMFAACVVPKTITSPVALLATYPPGADNFHVHVYDCTGSRRETAPGESVGL